jgi:hypothetical protein
MDDQFDGRAVARALRGVADAAPVRGDLPAVLQQLVDTAKTVLATDGVGLMLTDADGQALELVAGAATRSRRSPPGDISRWRRRRR